MFAYTARSNIADPPRTSTRRSRSSADPDRNLYAKTFEPSEGIHTRVHARALVLEQRRRASSRWSRPTSAALPFALTQEVLERIAATGITARAPDALRHPHALLDRADLAGRQRRLRRARRRPLRPAHLRAHRARASPRRSCDGRRAPRAREARRRRRRRCTDASRNREFDPFKLNPEAPADDDAAARAASIDPDAEGGPRRTPPTAGRSAAWSNFAIHPTNFGDGNLLFSGDNAASAERIAEARDRAGGRAARPPAAGPRFVNVWTNGNEGDISPERRPGRRRRRPAPVRADRGGVGATWPASGWRRGSSRPGATRATT